MGSQRLLGSSIEAFAPMVSSCRIAPRRVYGSCSDMKGRSSRGLRQRGWCSDIPDWGLAACLYQPFRHAATSSTSTAEAQGDNALSKVVIDDYGVRQKGIVKVMEEVFQNMGRRTFRECEAEDADEVNPWEPVLNPLTDDAGVAEELQTRAFSETGFVGLVQILAEKIEVTQATFWDKFTRIYCWDEDSRQKGAARARRPNEWFAGASENALIELARLYANTRNWSEACEIVYFAAHRKVMETSAVHWLPPPDLATLLDSFSKAGSFSQPIYRRTAELIEETQVRLQEDIHELDEEGEFAFQPEHLVTIVESMARIRLNREAMLQQIGRERLHKNFVDFPAATVLAVCHSYGELGWRHDTIFKDVTAEILAEYTRLQSDQALGRTDIAPLKYSLSDVAIIAQALLSLKMHRGNTTWCKWHNNYQDLLDILTRQLDAELQAKALSAKPLAATAFILGRARRGTDEMCQAILGRMMEILEEEDVETLPTGVDPPQYQLAHLVHGLAMMHPPQKDLDTLPLMRWVINKYFTLPLSDIVSINRHLVQMGCYDKDYLKAFEPLLCERVPDMKKDDIIHITNTFNGAGFRDEDFQRGRHLFWALGRRMQSIRVQHLSSRGQRRAQYKRIG